MRNIINIIHRVVSYICFTCTVLLFFMMLLTVADIGGRGILNMPVPGAFEITEYLLVVFVLGGIAYTQQVDQHIKVDFLTSKMSNRVHRVLDITFTFIGLVFMCVLIWQGWIGSFYALSEGATSDMLAIPDYIFNFFIPFGAFLFALELIIRIIELVTPSAAKG